MSNGKPQDQSRESHSAPQAPLLQAVGTRHGSDLIKFSDSDLKGASEEKGSGYRQDPPSLTRS